MESDSTIPFHKKEGQERKTKYLSQNDAWDEPYIHLRVFAGLALLIGALAGSCALGLPGIFLPE